MSRIPLPYSVGDVSALARSLRAQLAGRPEQPGHLAWLNMLAKAAGCRNYQHFAAQAAARPRPAPAGEKTAAAGDKPLPAAEAVKTDDAKLLKVARCFDGGGILTRWPSKRSEQVLGLWALWARLPSGPILNERQFNLAVQALHLFGDHALLRRELVELGLVVRTADGSEYRRVERRPPPEVLALLALLARRAAAA